VDHCKTGHRGAPDLRTVRPIDPRKEHMSNTVTLVGAGGFIGTNLRRSLLNDGFRVRAVSRSWLEPPEPGLERVLTADLEESEQLGDLLRGSTAVVVLSHGLLPGSSLDESSTAVVKDMGLLLRVIDECAKGGSKLVYLSSGGTIYGPDVKVPTPESAPCDPVTIYGVSKLTSEKILSVYAKQCGLNYVVLRVSNPYGPWQWGRKGQGVIGAWMARALVGAEIEVWGDGSVERDYIFISDVVSAIKATLSYTGSERVFNVGSGQGQSLRKVLSTIQNLRPVAVRNREARICDVPRSVLDVGKAWREMRWRPATSFEDGIHETWRWMSARLL